MDLQGESLETALAQVLTRKPATFKVINPRGIMVRLRPGRSGPRTTMCLCRCSTCPTSKPPR